MNKPSIPPAPDATPLTAKNAIQVLTAYVHAANAGYALSDRARIAALEALEVLQRRVA
jgi:hypothetical protein